MSTNVKIFVAIIITAAVVGGGMYFLQQKGNSNQNQVQQNTTTNPSAQTNKPNLYTDATSGVSFVLPTGWVTGTDEQGSLYTYRESPYLTVGFKVFTDKASWEKRINEWTGEIKNGNVTETTATIGGLSAKLLKTGKTTVTGYYYVDTGKKWFEIDASDMASPEIIQIIQSVKF